MLSEINKNVNAEVSVNITGESKVNDKVVAQYSAHTDFNSDDGLLIVNIIIYDKEKYKSDCSGDEAEFEEEAYDFEKQVMDKQEEIAGLFKEDESEDETDNADDTNNPDDSGDGKVGAGDEETIVP